VRLGTERIEKPWLPHLVYLELNTKPRWARHTGSGLGPINRGIPLKRCTSVAKKRGAPLLIDLERQI